MMHIATIGKAVGLKGEMKLHLFTDFPKQFKKDSIFKSDNGLSLQIEYFHQNKLVIKFIGYDSREDTMKLINKKLYSTEEQTRNNCHLSKDEYYWFDIIGCKIVENNEVLGEVAKIDDIASTYYFEVKTDEKLIEKSLPKIFLIPYIDNYILSVDIENKIIQSKNSKILLENS
jgi:16S rRNA processing protein RimM